MQDFLISMGFSVLFEILKSSSKAKKFFPAFAKLYLALDALAQTNSTFRALVHPTEIV